jgi:hypothetical protein
LSSVGRQTEQFQRTSASGDEAATCLGLLSAAVPLSNLCRVRDKGWRGLGRITLLGNAQVQLTVTGIAGLLYTIQGNSDLNTTNWVTPGEITAQPPSGALQFIDLDAANLLQRFYRLVLPVTQIRA